MSIESARSFILKMRSDVNFANQVIGYSDPDQQLSFLAAAGFNFTLDEFTDEMMNHENHITDRELHFAARLINRYIPVEESS